MLNEPSEYILNFGPHHPSTHGILRLILKLAGERVISCEPDIGYLHRTVEKIVEDKKFLSIIPYLDRLDYLAPLIQEHAYVSALEKALGIEDSIPEKALFIRTIFDELTRISSHIMAIGCLTYDLGCLSLFLYGFEEREKIMDIFESVTGARMHQCYYVPGGVLEDIPNETFGMVKEFLETLPSYLGNVEKMALDNRIFKDRTCGIGTITQNEAIENGLSGVNLRASGVEFDVRKSKPYGAYSLLDFKVLTLNEGDCYARNMLRYLEIKQSANLIRQCLDLIPMKGPIRNFGYFKEDEEIQRFSIEELSYASFFARGIEVPKSTRRFFSSTETPRGEFGVHVFTEGTDVHNGSQYPYRLHFKSPSFATIQSLKLVVRDCNLCDIPAILGSMDFIMGCCDR